MQAETNAIPPATCFDQKAIDLTNARLNIAPEPFSHLYNRQPFGFNHNLHKLDIFQFDSMRELADKFSFANRDFFIAGSAPTAGTDFYMVPHGGMTPNEALEQLDTKPLRILLKRPENHDERFRRLLDLLFQQMLELRGGIGREQVVRLESAILISSAVTTTPIHFDPEIGFFSQIEGGKTYHLYSPDDVSEAELERFYIRGVVDIGSLDMARRKAEHEHVFHLSPGKGMHQPQNSPHWVETANGRSISYTFVFETDATRALGRTRAFNHYERRIGLSPSCPGLHRPMDAIKAEAMRAVIPVRKMVGRFLETIRGE